MSQSGNKLSREQRIEMLTREYGECQSDAKAFADRWLSKIQAAEWRRQELTKLGVEV